MQTLWQPGPAKPRLDADTVDVWLVNLTGTRPEGPLDRHEWKRANRFVRAQDGRRWAVARAALRRLLGAYLGVAPEALRFEQGPHGKPRLAHDGDQGDLRFNLSHSGDVALIAVTRGREVGVDVELPRRAVDHVAIARRVLPADDADRIAAIEDAEQREREFLRAWVRWEAVLKCRGTGIGGADTAPDEPDPWVVEIAVEPPAAAALGVAGGPCAVRRWQWPAAAA